MSPALRDTLRDFVELVERSTASVEQNEQALELLLDRLALASHVPGPDAPQTDIDAPHRDYRALRTSVCERFPRFGWYTSGALEPGMELVGDAIDDVTDIALELSGVLWLWDNASETDALWEFHFGFEGHWGSHLRGLQWYLHALRRADSAGSRKPVKPQ